MEQFFILLILGFFGWRLWQMHKSGGIKAIFEKSRQAEQHWGTFIMIMVAVVVFVVVLIQA